MTKDEIIVLLKEQLQLANDTVSSLTIQVGELIERIKSLEEQLVQKGIAIDKANRQNRALGKLVSGKKSERQEKCLQDSIIIRKTKCLEFVKRSVICFKMLIIL